MPRLETGYPGGDAHLIAVQVTAVKTVCRLYRRTVKLEKKRCDMLYEK
jgi:hypothetical protein